MKKFTILFYSIALALIWSSCKNSIERPEPLNNSDVQPVAWFSWTGTQRVNADIQFTNESLNADSYKWNFGNGETSTKQTPDKVKYVTDGVYDVILTATKGERKAVFQQTLAIAANNNPLAHFSFIYKDQKTYVPATVTFQNESVNGMGYKWEINGTISNDPNPQYIFTQPGEYPVKLTTTNGDEESTFTDTVSVTANSNPLASFALAFHPFPYTVNEPIQLVNRSKNSDNWLWTFGTNGPAQTTDEHPEVKFAAAGNYTITLIAKKGALQSAPRSITIKINP